MKKERKKEERLIKIKQRKNIEKKVENERLKTKKKKEK